MNQLARVSPKATAIEEVLIRGDLSKLTPEDRNAYYMRVCESAGLNPLTQPFAYITLSGKLTLYALRNATDQLRTIHNVSVIDMQETERDGVFVVTVKVQNAQGRMDMAKGAVAIANLKGEALANALMKAETKAKRRATLSICGLGLLDETEVETIPGAKPEPSPVAIAKPATPPPADPETGEVGPRTLKVKEAGGAKNWIAFGSELIAAIQAAKTRDEATAWWEANFSAKEVMEREAPKVYTRLVAAIDARLAELNPNKSADEG